MVRGKARGRAPRRVKLPVVPAGQPLPAANAQPLPAGSFAEWLRATRRSQEQQQDMDVPCGECTACCRSSLFIHIRPEETDTLAQIDPRLLFPAPGAPPGHVLMGYDRQGRCPLLSASGCSIYEHRPRTCREFDCRTVAATGVALDAAQRAIAEQARRWRFDSAEPDDGALQAAVRAAAAFLEERGPELLAGALPSHPLQLAMLALRIHALFLTRPRGATDAAAGEAELARAIAAVLAGDAGAASAADAGDRATSVKRAPPSRP